MGVEMMLKTDPALDQTNRKPSFIRGKIIDRGCMFDR